MYRSISDSRYSGSDCRNIFISTMDVLTEISDELGKVLDGDDAYELIIFYHG